MNQANQQKEHIIQNTIHVFAKYGYPATTMELLINEGKLSRGLVIYYFGSLEGLLYEILGRIKKELETWLLIVQHHSTAQHQLQALLHGWSEILAKNPSLWQLYASLLTHNQTAEIIYPLIEAPFRESYHKTLTQIFREMGSNSPDIFINHFDTIRMGLIFQIKQIKNTELIDQVVAFFSFTYSGDLIKNFSQNSK